MGKNGQCQYVVSVVIQTTCETKAGKNLREINVNIAEKCFKDFYWQQKKSCQHNFAALQ